MSLTARSLAALSAILFLAAPLSAGQRPAQQPSDRTAGADTPAQVRVVGDQDAREVREQFERLLERQPPSVGRILKTDPSLMRNAAYMTTYPTIAAFLQEHPEIVNSPSYYFENVSSGIYTRQQADPKTATIELWSETLAGIAIFSGFALTLAGLIWVLKSTIEYRRWSRVARVQTEVHTKLLDRFTSNEDLLAYMQTTPGKRFLESAPLAADPPRPVGAPFSRILWSVQVGIVLMMGAGGVLYISTRVIEEVAQMLFAIGVLALAVGAGFVVSAVASFVLSRRLGLFESSSTVQESS